MRFFKNKDRALGVSKKKRSYDLPLNKGAGTGFIILLVALMTFLAVLALSSYFALSAMTDRWSSGLENRITVEIPAEDENKKALTREQIKETTTRLAAFLERHPVVKNVQVLSDEEITDLVKPWLGDDLMLQDIPVPGLISLELQSNDEINHQALEARIKSIAPYARLDTHEQWLSDLLSFTGALKFAAALLALIIGLTTTTAIAGAVRSRMEVYNEEVELLHLMGATDRYIAGQFQRHSFILTIQGALAGTVAGGIALILIGWAAGEMEANLLPEFTISGSQIFIIMLLPPFIGSLAILTAGKTVKKVIKNFP